MKNPKKILITPATKSSNDRVWSRRGGDGVYNDVSARSVELAKAAVMPLQLLGRRYGLLEEAEPLPFFHGEAYDLLAAAGLAFEQLQLAFLRKRKCNACGVLT